MTFAGAPRLHSGLAADEFPSILQRGEQVIPKGGGGGGIAPTIIINNNGGPKLGLGGQPFFDGEKWVVNIVAKNGEKWVVNIVAKNVHQGGQLYDLFKGK
jgi:hypothetical protein